MKMILIFLSDFWLSVVNLKNAKHLKKVSDELMPITGHPKRCWKFCILEDDKKEIEPIFTQ